MARFRRRRRRRRRTWTRPAPVILAGAILAAGVWWFYLRGSDDPQGKMAPPRPVLITERPEVQPEESYPPDVPERGALTQVAPAPRQESPPARQFDALVAAGKQTLEQGDLVQARTLFNDALQAAGDSRDTSLIRAELVRLANETIFSSRIFPDDPFVDRYVVQPGDTLAKIAKANKVTPDLLARINQIQDKNLIRAGQSLKIVKGPFHAVVNKSNHSMDVFLGETLVQHFKIGLGEDDSTPSGKWRVATKLVNPTYYPPRGGRIMPPDDPENPLGGWWIGLEGVAGEAQGQLRYGIHGTIEPESIGRNVSLGCIRLFNEDVEALYSFVIEKESTIFVND